MSNPDHEANLVSIHDSLAGKEVSFGLSYYYYGIITPPVVRRSVLVL